MKHRQLSRSGLGQAAPKTRSLVFLTLALMLVTACGGEAETSTTPTSSVPPSETTLTSASPTTAAESGGGTTLASNPDLPAPCTLLTAADIEAATGQEFGDGVFNDLLSNDEFAICDWTSTGDYATVQVLVSPLDSYDSQRASAADVFTVNDISVAGASAAYVAEGSVIGMRVDFGFLQVSYIPPGPGDVTEATAQLAAVAVGNLD